MKIEQCTVLVLVLGSACLMAPAADTIDGGAVGATADASAAGASDVAGSNVGNTRLKPSNVPPAMTLGAPGDWIFNSKTCSRNPEIDTATGKVSNCEGQKFIYRDIVQADTSQGSLPAGLFLANRFVVEQGMTVTVTGNRPLIVVALSDVVLSGQLQATVDDIHRDQANGGGADGPSKLSDGLGIGGGTRPRGTSGAGGGSFCGVGGAGRGTGADLAPGGKSYGNVANVPLLGGSSGGAGPYPSSGAGGGAIQIVSAVKIEVAATGVIHVGGGGGGWAGSGGGSGGAILLEAPAIRVVGTLAANGGGGGESGSDNVGSNASASDRLAPGGGPGRAATGGGGDGSAGATPNGADGTKGGGGGGGAGRIRLNTATGTADTTGATLSPGAATPCFSQGMVSQPAQP